MIIINVVSNSYNLAIDLTLHQTKYFQNYTKIENELLFLGINYSQCTSLIEEKLSAKKQLEEDRIRLEDTRKFCPYIDCNFIQAKEWCSDDCVGSKHSITQFHGIDDLRNFLFVFI